MTDRDRYISPDDMAKAQALVGLHLPTFPLDAWPGEGKPRGTVDLSPAPASLDPDAAEDYELDEDELTPLEQRACSLLIPGTSEWHAADADHDPCGWVVVAFFVLGVLIVGGIALYTGAGPR